MQSCGAWAEANKSLSKNSEWTVICSLHSSIPLVSSILEQLAFHHSMSGGSRDESKGMARDD